MVPPLLGLIVLARANRRRRRRLHRQVPRRDLSFGNLEKVARIVKQREVTQGLEQFTQMTIDSTSNAITMAQLDPSHRRRHDAAAVALVLPFTTGWQRRIQRKIRAIEASLFMLTDEYHGYRVKIYSAYQMQAMENLHSIGWRGNMSNPTENSEIAQRIDALLRS